jgi:hypothetical protein
MKNAGVRCESFGLCTVCKRTSLYSPSLVLTFRVGERMVFWLVTAKPRVERLGELRRRLDSREISRMRPFGRSLENGLVNAKLREDGSALWEEEDYCVPALAQERAAVLDYYFDNLTVEDIGDPGRGWEKLTNLPSLWHRDIDESPSSREGRMKDSDKTLNKN